MIVLKRDRQLSLSRLQPTKPSLKASQPKAQPSKPKPRKDPAAHVSLPSDALVKQLGALGDGRPEPPIPLSPLDTQTPPGGDSPTR